MIEIIIRPEKNKNTNSSVKLLNFRMPDAPDLPKAKYKMPQIMQVPETIIIWKNNWSIPKFIL